LRRGLKEKATKGLKKETTWGPYQRKKGGTEESSRSSKKKVREGKSRMSMGDEKGSVDDLTTAWGKEGSEKIAITRALSLADCGREKSCPKEEIGTRGRKEHEYEGGVKGLAASLKRGQSKRASKKKVSPNVCVIGKTKKVDCGTHWYEEKRRLI